MWKHIMLDYHIHTPLYGHTCYTMNAYVQAAIECGFDEMGFGDHPMMSNLYDICNPVYYFIYVF